MYGRLFYVNRYLLYVIVNFNAVEVDIVSSFSALWSEQLYILCVMVMCCLQGFHPAGCTKSAVSDGSFGCKHC